jgi:hypothetical protein
MSNAAETALLNLWFKNTAWANFGDAGGLQPSSSAGNLYCRLHTTDPGEAGTGDTNEISYTGYAPVAVARGAGFTVTGDTVANAGLVSFGNCTLGSANAAYFSMCLGNGAGAQILVSGALTTPIAISVGIQPQFAIGALSATVD